MQNNNLWGGVVGNLKKQKAKNEYLIDKILKPKTLEEQQIIYNKDMKNFEMQMVHKAYKEQESAIQEVIH